MRCDATCLLAILMRLQIVFESLDSDSWCSDDAYESLNTKMKEKLAAAKKDRQEMEAKLKAERDEMETELKAQASASKVKFDNEIAQLKIDLDTQVEGAVKSQGIADTSCY